MGRIARNIIRRLTAISIIGVVLLTSTADALAKGGPYTEKAYYDGEVYTFIIPSSSSASPNQLFVGCLNLGPNMTDQATGPVNTFYALFLPGAHQEQCPDGSLRHDHVLTTVPGVPGYAPLWHVIAVTPTAQFDPNIMPITSAAGVQAAVAAGQVQLSDTGIIFRASVIGKP